MKSETKYIFKTISINLLIAASMLLSMIGFDLNEFLKFIMSLLLNFFVGIVGLYSVGYLIGENLYRIKKEDKHYNIFHGILAIFSILILGTLIGSTVGFLQEGLPDGYEYNLKEELNDYYFKPLFWICFFGFIPTFISGIILGENLKKLYTTMV